MKVPWRGQDRHHITVGPDKRFTFQSLQKASDSITDSAADNLYLLDVADGLYREWVCLDTSFIDVSGQSRDGCIFWRDNVDPGHPNYSRFNFPEGSGGTISIAPDRTQFRESIGLFNLTAVRTNTNAPEAAVFVGKDEEFQDTLYYDNITITGVRGIGSHDGYQVIGLNHDATVFPNIFISWNLWESNHDAFTIKGNVRHTSLHNTSKSFGHGLPPFLTDEFVELWQGGPVTPGISNWKTTGYHHNIERGTRIGKTPNATTNTGPNPGCFVLSLSDRFDVQVLNNGNSDGREVCGLLIYTPTSPCTGILPHRFVQPKIRVIHDDDAGVEGAPAGILVNLTNVGGCIGEGEFDVEQCKINVEARNSGPNAPPSASGARVVNNQGDGLAWLRISGDASVSCASGPAYSLSAGFDESRIAQHVISGQPTRVDDLAQIVPWSKVA